MRPRVFIQSNARQWVGAVVSAHSMKRNSAHPDAFDVEILEAESLPFLTEKEGQAFLRDGAVRVWQMDDVQSFTPLRFLPPALMGHGGRALVVDPDVFAVGDVHELLTRDMQGRAVLARRRFRGQEQRWELATSVMLLDCDRLGHWQTEKEFGELFEFTRDYRDWILLRHELVANVGFLEEAWNDFDRLGPETRLLHNTRRRTQPWKTGLPIDFLPGRGRRKRWWRPPLERLRVRLFGTRRLRGRYRAHPDRAQERFFFSMLRECVDAGTVSEARLRQEMRQNHLRHDALELMERARVASTCAPFEPNAIHPAQEAETHARIQ